MRFLKNKPVFLIMLPVFFVFHGFTENYDFVPVKDALLLAVLYTAVTLAITGIAWLYFRDLTKAAVIALLLTGYNFIFGSIQDSLRLHFPGSFISRYSFILPVSLVFFLLLAILLKRRNHPLQKLTLYLNLLFLLLMAIDGVWLISKTVKKTGSLEGTGITGTIKCDTCKKPDIFFIILDEYSGNTALKEKFNFDNSGFENELRARGFYIASGSTSNYNYTPFSLASILNMQYLDLDMKTKGPGNLKYCYRMIRDSRVLKFLEVHDYKLYNYSVFDFKGQPAMNTDNFLPTRTKLITAQTFASRAWNDILYNVATGKFTIKPMERKIVYSHLHNNEKLIRLTLETASSPSSGPKFVYTHLMMPHYPYYFDSRGNALPFDSLVEGRQVSRQNYVKYLQHCNQRILWLTDAILKTSALPPIIILSGDHGFRYFTDKEDRKYSFMNLTSVRLPSGDYRNFYDSISAVNLFPAILNTQFLQRFPFQKDSTIFLWD